MNRKKFNITLLVLSIILLIAQLVIADYNNFWDRKNILGISVPVLLIISFYLNLKHINKQKK